MTRVKRKLSLAAALVFLSGPYRLVGAGESPHADICTLDNHCLNEGKCMPANYAASFKHCHCKDGFSGPRCSRYCPYDCKNGGYCTVKPKGGEIGIQEQTPTYDPSDYMCKCFGHFAGNLCETPYTNCGYEGQCFHGGACVVEEDNSHRCSCADGFSGDSCDIPMLLEEEPILTKGGKTGVAFMSILLIVLAAALALILNRRRSLPPKFIVVDDADSFRDEYPALRGYGRSNIGGKVQLNVL